jgi:hypothetical protein
MKHLYHRIVLSRKRSKLSVHATTRVHLQRIMLRGKKCQSHESCLNILQADLGECQVKAIPGKSQHESLFEQTKLKAKGLGISLKK